ncbi:MAG: type VI secretion system baseplate subunit TssK [Pseudomonadota bacterium]
MAVLTTDAIQWHEGMLLLPQHFQQNDTRQRELLHFHIAQMASFHWGIVRYEIDSVKLVDGTLYFTILEAVMPDGLVISSYASEGETVEIDLKQYEKDIALKPQLIYLAIPSYQHGAANATGANPRFTSRDSIAVVDENSGEGKITIPRMAPNVSLFVGRKPPSTYVSFPLFKIGSEANAFTIKEYIPPCLKVTKSSALGILCDGICKQIREKIAYLTDRLLGGSPSYIAGDTEAFARALSTGLLPFEALLNAEVAHPFNLYVGLCDLAGQIAGLLPAQIPPIFDPYNHNDLHATYSKVLEFITLMLNRIQEGYFVFPFEQSGRTFSIHLKKEWLNNKLILGAKAAPNMSRSELTKWIEECVIACESYLSTAMDNRILGASRKIILSDDEMKLVPPKGVILFEVEVDKRYIKPEEALKIINVSDEEDERPVEIVLYVPKQKL